MKPLVIFPTYNEAENIVGICTRVRSLLPDVEILVVDDNSPDGTAQHVLAMQDPAIHLLSRSRKEGLGPAYLAGFAWGIERGFDRLVQIDADGSHPVKSLPAMLAQSTQHDLVIGSRYTRGGGVANWPRRRQLLSRWGNRYVQRMLGLPVQDATAGLRVYTAAALTRIGVDGIEASGYAFQINMTWRAQQAGLSIVEVPIIFTDRAHGSSKMSGAIIREALVLTTKWGLRSRASALFAAK